jgi:RES domain-containing protein
VVVPNKRALILASSLATISLATLLVATALHRRRHKSPQTRGLLGQTRSTKDVDATTATHREQIKQKFSESKPTPWQESKTNAMTRTTNNATVTSKSTASVAVPPAMEPSSNSDSAVIVISPSQTPKEEEISVSDEDSKSG